MVLSIQAKEFIPCNQEDQHRGGDESTTSSTLSTTEHSHFVSNHHHHHHEEEDDDHIHEGTPPFSVTAETRNTPSQCTANGSSASSTSFRLNRGAASFTPFQQQHTTIITGSPSPGSLAPSGNTSSSSSITSGACASETADSVQHPASQQQQQPKLSPQARSFAPHSGTTTTGGATLNMAATEFVPAKSSQLPPTKAHSSQGHLDLSAKASPFVPTNAASAPTTNQHKGDKPVSHSVPGKLWFPPHTSPPLSQGSAIDSSATNQQQQSQFHHHQKKLLAPHIQTVSTAVPVCRYFVQKGGCHKGMQCPFRHDKSILACESLGQDHQGNTPASNRNNTAVSPMVDHKEQHDDNDEEDALLQRMSYTVEEGIVCEFEGGLAIRRILLGSDATVSPSKRTTPNSGNSSSLSQLCISGLSESVTDDDIRAVLKPHGVVSSMTRNKPTYALVTFAESKSANAALSALDGSTLDLWTNQHLPNARNNNKNTKKKKGSNKKGGTIPSLVSVSQYGSSLTTKGVTVKVMWYAPSQCAWAHFHTLAMASAASKACNKKVFRGRVIVTNLVQPSWRQRDSFSMWIGGLPGWVDIETLKSFIRKQSGSRVTSVSLGKPPFRDSEGPNIVKSLLEQHGGKLSNFEPATENSDPLKRKALVKFSTPDGAAKACAYFGLIKGVPELGGSKLLLTRVYAAKRTLPNRTFSAIEGELQSSMSNLQDARYNFYKNEKSTTISLISESPAALASAKLLLKPLLAGDPVAQSVSVQRLWRSQRMVALLEDAIRKFSVNHEALALVDRRKREIRLFGSSYAKSKLEENVLAYAEQLLTESKVAVAISDEAYVFLLDGGRALLDKLIAMTFVKTVSLDIKNRGIIVEGGDASDARRVVSSIGKLQRANRDGHGQDAESQLCPVCFCPPGEEEEDSNNGNSNAGAIHLPCSHNYCRECFREWLTGNRNCQYPLRCLAQDCSAAIPVDILSRALPSEEFLRSLREAVDDHVNKHLDSFQFCLNPGCAGICQTGPESRVASCSTCETVFCLECKVEEHDGLSCKEQQEASLPPDRLKLKIVDEILTLQCPRCSLAFLDFEGCFALRCHSCQCGFCGWCLEDCGDDAHDHVADCPHKLGTDKYFGTQEQFDRAQRQRRQKALIAFLRTLKVDDRARAIQSVQSELKDLGITVPGKL